MPAKSAKQANFMRAVAHSPAFAKKVGVSKKVGEEFSKKKGGPMAKGNMSVGNVSSKTKVPFNKGGTVKAFGKGGSVRSGIDGIAKKGHTKGKCV